MFALTCPHCKHEIQTRFARPGATVACIKCRQTFLLDARNTRELAARPAVAVVDEQGAPQVLMMEAADGSPGGSQSASKVAMAAMREMADEMGELAPEVDIYAAAPSAAPGNGKAVKVILAVAVLVVVLVGALWLVATTPAIRDLFKSDSARPVSKQPVARPAPPVERKPDGTAPAQDF